MSALQELAARSPFKPTLESIPPKDVVYRFWASVRSIPVHLTPLNPVSFLLRAALICPDKLAIAHPDARNPAFYSFAVWAQRCQNLAYALIQRGIKPGDRVAVIYLHDQWFQICFRHNYQ